jgi:hypothetical protein
VVKRILKRRKRISDDNFKCQRPGCRWKFTIQSPFDSR